MCDVQHSGPQRNRVSPNHGWREWSRSKANGEMTMTNLHNHELSIDELDCVAGGGCKDAQGKGPGSCGKPFSYAAPDSGIIGTIFTYISIMTGTPITH
jgi:hypothetical protein